MQSCGSGAVSSCSVSCSSGYSLQGPVTSCSNGVLTATQSCVPSPCSVSAPANGTLGSCPSTLSSGTSCQVACASGYTIVGISTSCSFGTLVSQQSCSPSACTVTAPTNGNLGTCPATLSSGSSCQMSCNSGFILLGTQTSCTAGVLAAQSCSPPTAQGGDAPLPGWALAVLAIVLLGIVSARFGTARP